MKTMLNLATIAVMSKTRVGTLESVNCDILPKTGKDADPKVKELMGALNSVYKNSVRYSQAQTLSDSKRYQSSIQATCEDIMSICGFDRSEWMNLLFVMGLKFNKNKNVPVMASATTFKKHALRVLLYAQKEARFCETQVKPETAKEERVQKVEVNWAKLAETLGCSVAQVMEAYGA